MQINLENLIPITEANQNFSKGLLEWLIVRVYSCYFENNRPKYVLVDYNTLVQEEQTEAVVADQASVDEVASSILSTPPRSLEGIS